MPKCGRASRHLTSCRVPPGAAGTVDVQVTTPGDTSATSSADHYAYIPPPPTVTSVSPASGPQTGGNTVTITGTNLLGATVINFSGGGGDATTFSCTSSTTCTVTSPAESAGTVDITVTAPGGTSATSSCDRYTYH